MNMRIKTGYVIFVCATAILFCGNAAKSQNMLGYTSNYCGVIGTFLNPSSISNSKLKLDVNVFTFGGHLQTNYYYIPRSDYSTLNPFKNGFADFDAYQGYNTNNKHNYLYTKEQMYLPSVMYSDGKKAYGFHIGWRFESDTRNAPNDIVRCLYEGMFAGKNTTQELNVVKHADKFHFAIGSWEELGGTYSKTLLNDGSRYFAAGVTGNLLLGNAAYFYNNKKIDYYFEDTTSISFVDMYSEFGGSNLSGFINGLGVGADLGVTYCLGDSAENRTDYTGYFNYKYKFGVALLDVGGIRYGKGKTYRINSYEGPVDLDDETLEGYENLDEEVDGTITKDHLSFYLPTALSLQFDYNVNKKVFVSANFIHNIRFTGCQIRRPTILSVTPRYEKRWFEISLPLSIYDWKLPRIGFEMRVWNITVGAEKIGWLFKFQDYTGVDGYISFRYNIGKKTIATSNPLY
jgi:hypothetical protein